MRLQQTVFQKAVVIAMAEAMPHAVTVTMEALVDGLSTRKHKGSCNDYRPIDWARDFLDCLPSDPEAQRLILLCYLPVYVCQCNSLSFDGGRCDDCGSYPLPYSWPREERARLGGVTKEFWRKVQEKRLFSEGLRLAEREK